VIAPLLVRAARGERVERTPVWFMRQAGRSLPEYRAIRVRHSVFELAGTPELCTEVTLQPVRRHGVDAAVLFADIMSPVLGMGVDVDLVEGVGPVVAQPIASRADVERLRVSDPDEAILEAIRLVRAELDDSKALVGFCGAPFTVAGYLVEGKPSRDFPRTKSLMYRDPETWHALLDTLAEQFARYVRRRSTRARTRFRCSTRGSACSRLPTTTSSSRPTRRGSSTRWTRPPSTSAPVRRRSSSARSRAPAAT
jgi:uroporphyrinogen decarboxylase